MVTLYKIVASIYLNIHKLTAIPVDTYVVFLSLV
jgi:hypothetical protein|nr:MAG TPA: hypothetical protein [Caudoviricetes sp.]